MQDKSISIRKLYEKFAAGEDLAKLGEVTVEGWVRTNRNNGKIGFIALHDGTCFKNLQVVYENVPDFEKISHYPLSAAIEVKGQIVMRSEEHTSELQSPDHLVCCLLLEKKKNSQTGCISRVQYINPQSRSYLLH